MSQWILSKDEFDSIPQFKSSTMEEERIERYKATGLLQALGMKLQLPQMTIATAQVFLHRFYLRSSYRSVPPSDLIPGLIYVAAKCEEHPRKVKDVLAACENSKLTAERIWTLERIILTKLCFDLSVEHPYRWVFKIIRDWEGVSDDLVHAAWIIVNDSFRTMLCLRHSARNIALAAVYFAAKRKNIELPAKSPSLEDCPKEEMDMIHAMLHDLYDGKYATTSKELNNVVDNAVENIEL